MKLLRVGAAALNQIPLNWEHNTVNIISAIKEAKNKKIDVLCLPELCITGYGVEDFFHSRNVLQKSKHHLNKILEHTQGIVVSVGLPISHKGGTYNCSAIIADGFILGYIAKRNLAGDGNHYEGRWFSKWPDGVKSTSEDGLSIGDIHFNINGIKIGQEICEDSWTDARPGIALSQQGVDIIMNPSASHFSFNKDLTREKFVSEGSRAFNCVYVYSNLLGNESGRLIFDGDTVIASNGEVVASGETLSFKDYVITHALVDIDTNRTNRARTFSHRTQVVDSELCIYNSFVNLFDDSEYSISTPLYKTKLSKEEQFEQAIGLGLFDYLRKSKSKGFVISLSGGADSATIAFIIYFMVNKAISTIGLEAFKNKLGHIDLDGLSTTKEIVNRLLTCVYQSSDNSSDITSNAAKSVADSIGAKYYHINIEDVVSSYISKIENTINRQLNWNDDDITLQNIQARSRSPSAWMYANVEHKLLLTTSNRSEAAVGYATAGGDLSGSLCPIAGVDKFFIKHWLNYMFLKVSSDNELLNLADAFAGIVRQKPTAELRPTEQSDEEDLMPYDILDMIECLSIRDKKSPLEIYKTMKLEKNIESLLLGKWIDKFFKMWCRNQWKREQIPLSFQLDQLNLDPKSWCRFPILNSGFEEELQEMWEFINRNE